MTFLMGSSLLMVGLLTVSIPIIIHLLHRQKTTPLLWGAMMFLKESALQMKRRKQVDHWLLMLLRMAALALLAWLLARPLFNAAKLNPMAGKESVDVALVIDHSMSMGRHHGDKTLQEEAAAVVDRLTTPGSAVLRNGDTLSVILAEHDPRSLTPAPLQFRDSNAMGEIRTKIHALKPGTTDCTIPVAIEAAREVVNHGPNIRKVVLVVSDEQKANWNIGDFAAWRPAIGEDATHGLDRHVEIHSYPIAADDTASNINIGDITIQPTPVGINRPVQLTATVANSGPKDVASINIHFSVNGKEIGAPQTIPNLGTKQSVTVRFDHTFTTPGSAWVRIWTDVIDAMAADNESVAAVHVWEKLPVLVIDGQLTSAGNFKSSMFLTAAMQPVDPDQNVAALIQPNVISVSDTAGVNLDDYYLVVLNDVPQLPPDFQNKLAGYVSSGHGLWVILGQRSSSQFVTSLGMPNLESGQVLFSADMKQATPQKAAIPATVEVKDPNNRMVAIMTAGDRNALSGALAKNWWSLTPRNSEGQVVLASSTGDPLVIDRPLGSGRVAVWTTSVDGEWNNWHVMPNFVPLVNETVNQLCAAQTSLRGIGKVEPGVAIAWTGPAAPAVQSADVKLPDGTDDKARPVKFRDGHHEFTYTNTFMPGLYQVTFPAVTAIPQPIFYGVSINARELDNTPLGPDDQKWLVDAHFLDKETPRVDPDKLGYVVTRMSEGSELWKYLAGFVVLSLCLETFMTFRMAGLQKKVDVAGAGLLAKA